MKLNSGQMKRKNNIWEIKIRKKKISQKRNHPKRSDMSTNNLISKFLQFYLQG